MSIDHMVVTAGRGLSAPASVSLGLSQIALGELNNRKTSDKYHDAVDSFLTGWGLSGSAELGPLSLGTSFAIETGQSSIDYSLQAGSLAGLSVGYAHGTKVNQAYNNERVSLPSVLPW